MIAQFWQKVSRFCGRWCWWLPTAAPPPSVPENHRPTLVEIMAMEREQMPQFVQESPAAQSYLELLRPLDWAHFPERSTLRLWPGRRPIPRASFVAAYLIKLDKKFKTMPDLYDYLAEQPALVWLLGFRLAPSAAYPWGFDVAKSLPTPRHFSRVLRSLQREQVAFLLRCTVRLLDAEFPPEELFGDEISLDTKHILAWVVENNPKVRIPDRYDKERQPKGDPDCKVGCKTRHNKPTHDGSANTPTQEGLPASHATVGEFYWGYASGVVATKVDDFGEFVLSEMTQTFDQSDQSYFQPLMDQTDENLGRKPRFGALDKAYDAFYVYERFHLAGGFAAVPWSDSAAHKKTFTPEGLPLCQAGLAMPLKSKHMDNSGLVPHQCARYACPLLFPKATGEPCPLDHKQWPKGGCITTLPTSPGNKIRHELDRESPEYKRIYAQRSASERINSQAVALGIERPKLRNQRSISNQNTLIYVLINLRGLHRVRQLKTQPAKAQSPGA